MSSVKTVGVVGAGVMGAGVAESAAEAGFSVVLVDVDDAILQRAMDRMRASMRMRIMLHRQTHLDLQEILTRITTTTNQEDLASAEFIVENVVEDILLKETLYSQLDSVCKPETVIAADTSCVPINRLAAATKRPDKIIGIHFMNPVPLKATVEVIRGPETSDATLSLALDVLKSMDKEAIVVNDAPGFVSNRVLMLTINEAIQVLQEETADAESIDRIFRECFGHKMGPLETADLIGLDTIRNSLLVLEELLGEKFQPSRLLNEKVENGQLGRKAGRGFHMYGSAE